MSGEQVEWDDLSWSQKKQFALHCQQWVDLASIEEAERYYGDKEQLIQDMRGGE